MTKSDAVEAVTPGRAYESPLRRARAQATRGAVLDAAATLFVRDGYLRTTMKAIAGEARTSVETVYAQGGKSALLLACVDRALGGDEDDVPLTDRADFAAALAHPDAADVVEGYVRAFAVVGARAGGLLVAFEDAAASDTATAELWAAAEQHRRLDLRRLVVAVAERGPLAHGWSVETATDAVWLVVTPRAAHTALTTLGWSIDLMAEAVTAQLRALLLPRSTLPTSGT
ncbi:TetR/AcrR family transcriptional regulator [Blastococcus sp. TBT05-19]|uniref:TetR/AcrR family transcriptional regulator n=1 Tax=Blastococcus sp. TBT05-19 TaxID=2250581 RepID=UPI000DE878D1|nr:TetR/AcrR family transcriptional regulator [Blastococcus sp. TBT05-19]RBY91711.1 TetR/AcrR family transcriptional regulator [Blastococcus sp. TBT05-19]